MKQKENEGCLPPPWWFFDSKEQRETYEAWLDEPPSDRRPKVVPLRPLADRNPEGSA